MLRELKEGLRDGSAEEYLRRLYEKIDKSQLNGFTTLARERALDEARRFDQNPGIGLLAGVPIAIKECISTKGIETNCSSRILRGYIPPYDAHVIEALKAEGAIIMGKTNMDEFAMGSSSETSFYGPVRNPWDPARVPGGSSGGSAAALAARKSGDVILSVEITKTGAVGKVAPIKELGFGLTAVIDDQTPVVGEAGVHLMGLAAQEAQHAHRVGRILRLAEHLIVERDDRVRPDDHAVLECPRHGVRLQTCQRDGVLGRGQPRVERLGDVAGDNLGFNADLAEKVEPPGRARGKNEGLRQMHRH